MSMEHFFYAMGLDPAYVGWPKPWIKICICGRPWRDH